MTKRNRKAATAAAVIQAPATVTTKGTAKVQVIKSVKSGLKYRGAREAWYNVLVKYEGKPAADFLAYCTSNPPSHTKKGNAEPASGWLRFFTRTGAATLE